MLKKFYEILSKARDEKGQTLIEYVLVLVLIVLVLIFAFRTAGVKEAVGTRSGEIANTIANTQG